MRWCLDLSSTALVEPNYRLAVIVEGGRNAVLLSSTTRKGARVRVQAVILAYEGRHRWNTRASRPCPIEPFSTSARLSSKTFADECQGERLEPTPYGIRE